MFRSHSHAVVTTLHGGQSILTHLMFSLGSRWLVQRHRVHVSFWNSMPGCKQADVHVRKHRYVTLEFSECSTFIEREKEKNCLAAVTPCTRFRCGHRHFSALNKKEGMKGWESSELFVTLSSLSVILSQGNWDRLRKTYPIRTRGSTSRG